MTWPRRIPPTSGDRGPADIKRDVVTAMRDHSNNSWFAVPAGVEGTRLVRYVVDRNAFDVYSDGKLLNYLDGVAIVEIPAVLKNQTVIKMPQLRDIEDSTRRKILASPEEFFPPIEGIYDTPFLTPQGRVVSAHGYDASTRIYLRWQEPMPPRVTKAQSGEVFSRLTDFNFASASDTAHALGLYLLPMLRPMITGPTPFHLILAEAGSAGAGSGKTYFSECFNAWASHDPIPNVGWISSSEYENTLRLARALTRSPPLLIVWCDNIKTDTTFGGEELHRLLTSYDAPFATRAARSAGVEVLVRCMWVGTGNDIDVDREMARRVVPIRILPRTQDYMTPDLKKWIKNHRGLIAAVFLQWIQNWLDEGCPQPRYRLTSFEKWSDVIGGILTVNMRGNNGGDCFLAPDHRPVAEQTREEVRFIDALREAVKDLPFQAADAAAVAKSFDGLPSTPGGMGKWLAKHARGGDTVGAWKVVIDGQVHKQSRFRLVAADTSEPAVDARPEPE